MPPIYSGAEFNDRIKPDPAGSSRAYANREENEFRSAKGGWPVVADDLDLDGTRRQLRATLAAIDAGELDAEPGQRAYLAGAVGALDALDPPPFEVGDGERLPVPVELGAEMLNALVSKVVEALVLMQSGDQMVAATLGGLAGGSAKSMLVGGHRLWARRQERMAEAAEAAAETSGLDVAALFERAVGFDDERRLDLLIDAFQAASREANAQKVRAFGRLAAAGVVAEQDAELGQAQRIFDTLVALDEIDLQVLLHMGLHEDQPWFQIPHEGVEHIRVLSDELPKLIDMLDPVISRLIGQGLLIDRLGDTSYADAHVLSPFARLCIVELMRGDDAGTGRSPAGRSGRTGQTCPAYGPRLG